MGMFVNAPAWSIQITESHTYRVDQRVETTQSKAKALNGLIPQRLGFDGLGIKNNVHEKLR